MPCPKFTSRTRGGSFLLIVVLLFVAPLSSQAGPTLIINPDDGSWTFELSLGEDEYVNFDGSSMVRTAAWGSFQSFTDLSELYYDIEDPFSTPVSSGGYIYIAVDGQGIPVMVQLSMQGGMPPSWYELTTLTLVSGGGRFSDSVFQESTTTVLEPLLLDDNAPFTVEVQASAVPEPALGGTGLLLLTGLAAWRRRRMR